MLVRTGIKTTAHVFPIGNTQGKTNASGIYQVLLNQIGTSAPVATIVENTVLSSLVWSYESVGVYKLSLNSGWFTIEKTITRPEIRAVTSLFATGLGTTPPSFIVLEFDTDNFLLIRSFDANFSPVNGLLVNFPLRVELYE